jgi:uncharacterized protein (TIGR02231 family)
MKKITFLLLVIIVSINLFSQVKEVVVYNDRSLVTRIKKEKVTSGVNNIIFKSLPISIDTESLRANGLASKGTGLKILDIKLIKNYQDIASEKDWKKLEEEINDTKEQINKLKAELKRIENQKKIMEIFSIQTIKTNNDDLENGRFSTKQWAEAYNFYQAQTKNLDSEYFKINKELKKINEILIVLQDKYSKYQNRKSYYTLDAIVSCQLQKESNIEISLTYIVPNTYWYPVYDCRLDLDTKKIIIEYYAKVYQNTGEDWNNINLILSTARPDLSGQIPEIYPWQLDFYTYADKKVSPMVKKYKRTNAKEKESIKSETEMGFNDIDEAEEYQAEIDSKGVAINYSISQKTDIPSTKEQTKVTISTGIKFDPALSWAIVPRYNTSSFLKGKIKNNSNFTLLPGKISLFVNDSFIGKSNIELINPNQEFELSLGRDPRIEVKFKLVDIEKGKKIGKKFEKRKYLITIQNNSNEDININIKDIIPKSLQPKKITVKIIKINPEPKEIKEESICIWNIEIKKGMKFEIKEEWIVEYPEGENISGL